MTKIEEIEQRLEVMEKVAKAYGIFKEEVEQLQKALAELKESKKENVGKWKPKDGEMYWFRDRNGEMNFFNYDKYNKGDNWRINNIPIFPTKEECEKYWKFRDAVKEKSYEFSEREWGRYNLPKWYIRKIDKRICVDCVFSGNYYGAICFKTKEDAQYIIDNFKEELLKYWI